MLNGCTTTRIFCRPDCPPGRRTLPSHRVAFASEPDARAAGYRPCRVCKPDEGPPGPWRPKSARRVRANAFATRLLEWASEEGRNFAWREEEDAFRLLLAEVLLQRSRSSTVERVFKQVVARWPTADALASADMLDLAEALRPLGLTGRATRVKELARALAERGSVPTRSRELRELPGVGAYVAGATAAALQTEETPLVDSVSVRVFRRYFAPDAAISDNDLAAMAYADAPPGRWRELNWAALDLAALICLPRRPRCGECPVAGECAANHSDIRG